MFDKLYRVISIVFSVSCVLVSVSSRSRSLRIPIDHCTVIIHGLRNEREIMSDSLCDQMERAVQQ